MGNSMCSTNSVDERTERQRPVNSERGGGNHSDSRVTRGGRSMSTLNQHNSQPDIKIHTVVTGELDFDHAAAMKIPLGDVTDEQLLAEVARRKLDLHDKITDTLVRETYEFGRLLGVGASGEVVLVNHKDKNGRYACKIVKKDSSMNDAQSMSTEIEIMKRIRHRNVVSMYELYESPKCLWIILELVEGGDLLSYLASQKVYTEVIAAKVIKQILQGVHYLHSLGIVHRDLKLDNILLSDTTASADVKIADFGLSALVRLGVKGYDPDESSKRKKFKELTEMWGTKEYFAPEMIKQQYGPQADVWALGCMMYEMLSGKQTFPVRNGDTESTFFSRISEGAYDISLPVWAPVSDGAKNLLTNLLQVDPNKRLSASEALLHPWLSSVHSRHSMLRGGSISNSSAVEVELPEALANLKKKQEAKLKKKVKKHSA